MQAPHAASELARRGKCAAAGLAITLVPVAALACAQFFSAPHTVIALGMNPKIDTWAVASLRSALIEGYSVVALIVSSYWLLTAVFGRGQLLKIKSANIALVLSGLTFALAMTIASIVPTLGTFFKHACPLLGLPDTMPPLPAGEYRFDGQTSCEVFATGAAPIVLLGVPLVLLASSAILRIAVSRRRSWRIVR